MNLTAKELCEIILACKEAHVTELKIGDIHIVFSAKPIVADNTPVPKPLETEQAENFTPIKVDEFSTNPKVEDEKTEIEELQISDPVRYEEMLGRGELIDDESATHN